MRILFITSGSIGDVIMATGLIDYLTQKYETSRFTFATNPASAALFEGFPHLERIIIVQKMPRHGHWLKLWQDVRRERWDLVVDLRGSLISFLVRTRKRKIFHLNDKSKSKIEQLGSLFNLSPAPRPRLWVTKEASERAKTLLQASDYVVMVPKSNSPFKDWPVERFAELAERIVRKPVFAQTRVVVMALERQRGDVAPLLSALPQERVIDLTGKTDIAAAVAVLQNARLFIGNDSGFLHMAAGLQTPCVGLYGPTNDVEYAPRGPHIAIAKVRDFVPGELEIQDASLIRKLTVDRAEAAVDYLLSTSAISSAA